MNYLQKELYKAIVAGNVQQVIDTIKSGVNINEPVNSKGMTPLILAITLGHFGMTRCLIKMNADVNLADKNSQTPLMAAAAKDGYDYIKHLLKAGADIEAQNANGQNALMLALQHKREKNAFILLNAGIKIHSRDKNNMPAIMYAAKAGLLIAMQKIFYLGATVNVWNKDKQSPLIFAIQNENEQMVEWLLSVNANTLAKDKDNKRPINYARYGSKIYKMVKKATLKEESARKITSQNKQISPQSNGHEMGN